MLQKVKMVKKEGDGTSIRLSKFQACEKVRYDDDREEFIRSLEQC